jgi:hypothetical protein
LTVVNCSFNGTEYGLRLKSDNASNSGGEGGVAQNLLYSNLAMTIRNADRHRANQRRGTAHPHARAGDDLRVAQYHHQ